MKSLYASALLSLTSCSLPIIDAGQAFDLVCIGETGAVGETLNFRFDLEQEQWCIDDCSAVWYIDSISDSMIKLNTYNSSGGSKWTFEINRYTATFAVIKTWSGDEPKDWGQCEAKAFSGFPDKSF